MKAIDSLVFERIIIHKIHSKNDTTAAYCDPSTSLSKLGDDIKKTLKARIVLAVKKTSRFFETSVDKSGEGSFFDMASTLHQKSDKDFITISTEIGHLAAHCHDKKSIADGLLLVIDCRIDGKICTIVIKAEFQEAFSMNGSAVSLIKDLFLSPGKELYKIGFLMLNGKDLKNVTSYESYVYDDQFNSKTLDIATYFGKEFLGFGTSSNAKMNTKKFYEYFNSFVDSHVEDNTSRNLLKSRLKSEYRESTEPLIAPVEFSSLFEGKLKEDFNTKVVSKFKGSFEKDLSLVDSSLKKDKYVVIPNEAELLVGPNIGVDIFNSNSPTSRDKLILELQSGRKATFVQLTSKKEPEL